MDQEIDHDLNITAVDTNAVTVDSEAAGTVTPSEWLQKSGGRLSGKITLADVSIQGDLDVRKHFINDVDLRDVVTDVDEGVVGHKSFEKLVVEQKIVAHSVNDVSCPVNVPIPENEFIFLLQRNFGDWFETLALKSDDMKFSGSVIITGAIHVDQGFNCQSINGMNVSNFPEILVSKDSQQLITGNYRRCVDIFNKQN